MNKIATAVIVALAITTLFLGVNTVMADEGKIPAWIKGVFGYYVQGDLSDSELIDALEFLIAEGIIPISEKQYEPFSKEKFPSTGGFNPAWLAGERESILEACADAKVMGFQNVYCKYVQ